MKGAIFADLKRDQPFGSLFNRRVQGWSAFFGERGGPILNGAGLDGLRLVPAFHPVAYFLAELSLSSLRFFCTHDIQ